MPFSDTNLSRRLERAEGSACIYAAGQRPGAEWAEIAGAYAVVDTPDSPITQSFGLGLFEAVTAEALDRLEEFFLGRGTAPTHEVSPLAGLSTFKLLCERGYVPIEISSVLYLPLPAATLDYSPNISVGRITPEQAPVWAATSARGWSHENPELAAFAEEYGTQLAARPDCHCFLATLDGHAAAAGSVSLHEGVALFSGAATVAEYRRKGMQSALLTERLRYAAKAGCDLAMMVAEAGGESQRNAERKGFQIAYTRLKWRKG